MADNVTFQDVTLATPVSSTVIATDNIAGINHQRVKVEFGVDGTATDVSATNPLPVVLTTASSFIGHVITDATSTTIATQATAANLNATVIGTGTFGVQVTTMPVTHIIADSGTITTVGAVTAITNALPAGSNVIGHVIADTGSITAVTGNVTVVQATAANLNATVTGTVIATQATAANLNVTAAIAAGSATIGKVYTAYQTTKALTNAAITISSSGDNTIVSGTAAQTIRVFKLVLVAAVANNITLKNDTAGTALTGAIPLTANGAITIDSDESGEPEFISAAGGNFVVNLSAAQSVTGYVQYTKS